MRVHGRNSFVATTHASRAGEVERNQSNLVAHFRLLGPSYKQANISRTFLPLWSSARHPRWVRRGTLPASLSEQFDTDAFSAALAASGTLIVSKAAFAMFLMRHGCADRLSSSRSMPFSRCPHCSRGEGGRGPPLATIMMGIG